MRTDSDNKQRYLHRGLAAIGAGLVLMRFSWVFPLFPYSHPPAWRVVIYFGGGTIALVSFGVGLFYLYRSQRI